MDAGSTREGRALTRTRAHVAAEARRASDRTPPGLEWCRTCRRDTDTYAVYWYTQRHVYQPPIVAIDGTIIASIESRVFVDWCFEHRGAPPAVYDAPIPRGARRQQK